jgi:hypothetical protein
LNQTVPAADDISGTRSQIGRCAQQGTVAMIARALLLSLLSAAALAVASPAAAQNCTRTGTDVTCDDGRRGVFTGDAIVWPDGTRANLASPHPSVIIGNKSSVVIGPGVFAGNGKGGYVPMDNPSAPGKARCPILDGVAYCF